MGRRVIRRFMLPSAFCEWMAKHRLSSKAAAYVLDVSQGGILDWRTGRSPVSWSTFIMVQTVNCIEELDRRGIRWDTLMEIAPSWGALRERMATVRSWPVKRGRPRKVRDVA